MSDLVGTEVGRYRITRVLGEGGMGTVYEGVQAESGASVAIKVLAERYARDRALLDRFFSEARATNVIAHENIVKVHDLAQLPDGQPYIVMELLAGQTLRAIIASGEPLPIGGVLDAGIAVLSALSAAHAAGIVHRDIKPDNIFITTKGRVKVLDFGVAKLSGAHAVARTETGVLLGTPEYMAPEQIRDGSIDARSDLYAFGIVLFEALTGRRPFDAKSDFEIMRAHVEREAPPVSSLRGDLPPHTDDVIRAAIAKHPNERFASATAMANALRHLATQSPLEQWRSLVPGGRLARPRPPSSPQLELPSGPRTLPTVAERPRARAKPRRRGVVWAAAGIVIAGAAGALVATQLRAADAPVAAAVPAPQPPPTETPSPATIVARAPEDDPPPAVPSDHERPSRTPNRAPVATTEAAPPDARTIVIDAAESQPRMVTGQAINDFDWVEFLPTATAVARETAPDAEWVAAAFERVSSDGTLSNHGDIIYDYRSKSAAKGACGIRVTVLRGEILVARAPDIRCDAKALAIPRCTLKDLRERTRATMPKSLTYPVSVSFSGGMWNVHNSGEDTTLGDACDKPLQTITRKLWTIETGPVELATLGTNALAMSRAFAPDTQLTGIAVDVTSGTTIEYSTVDFTYSGRDACVKVRVFGSTMRAHREPTCEAKRAIKLPKCSPRGALMKIFDEPGVTDVSMLWDGFRYTIRVRKAQGDLTVTEEDRC